MQRGWVVRLAAHLNSLPKCEPSVEDTVNMIHCGTRTLTMWKALLTSVLTFTLYVQNTSSYMRRLKESYFFFIFTCRAFSWVHKKTKEKKKIHGAFFYSYILLGSDSFSQACRVSVWFVSGLPSQRVGINVSKICNNMQNIWLFLPYQCLLFVLLYFLVSY